ncbi:uncharacterized protein METZ01_LOCUS484994, partial [marine metagenome]
MWMVPRCWGPGSRPGQAVKSGSSLSARLSLKVALEKSSASIERRKDSSSRSAGSSFPKVICGPALENTLSAAISSPDAVLTPFAVPS